MTDRMSVPARHTSTVCTLIVDGLVLARGGHGPHMSVSGLKSGRPRLQYLCAPMHSCAAGARVQ